MRRGKMILFIGLVSATAALAAEVPQFFFYRAPAGERPATREIMIDGYKAAVLPNGKIVTPVGVEVNIGAPKSFGLALSPDGGTLATVNSGTTPFSVTLIRGLAGAAPTTSVVRIDSAFMGIEFSPDGSRFYVAGGEIGNIWVGDTAENRIIGSVNLNAGRPFNAPMNPLAPSPRFKGTFPGRLTVSRDGRYLFVVDQGAFEIDVVDTTAVVTGTNEQGQIIEPNNFAAVVNRIPVGRYPFAVTLSPDGRTLIVANVGTFEYTHLRPGNPTGDDNVDYPLCFPGAGYPGETENDRVIKIKPVDPRALPATLRDPEGIRCGYVGQELVYTVPGLGSPNAAEAHSVYVIDVADVTAPVLRKVVKTGPLVGELAGDREAYAGSHPNYIVHGPNAVYVANGNDDSISVLDVRTYEEVSRIPLSPLKKQDAHLRGVQPVGLALGPDGRTLYAALAGLNSVAVIKLTGTSGKVEGYIPTGWWPSEVEVSADGGTLFIASARGRGAGPNDPFAPGNIGGPKSAILGMVQIVKTPNAPQLKAWTDRVLINAGILQQQPLADARALTAKAQAVRSAIKHVVFINKENLTHDLVLGDILQTRKGVPVVADPRLALGADGSPNHHELALSFTFSDNFYLEPSVSSDGHRWLTNTYTAEFEETHWPASYGGRRRDAGDDPNVFVPYPGRLGFTDANSSPEPNDYNQHGGIYAHLARNGKTFVNFGNGYELAQVDEPGGAEPTGIRNHVNVPMEKVVRDNTDHMYPEYNTHIPDAPLPEDPTRFNRFSRFKQVFETYYVDREAGTCNLPDYVDLYLPNDHGGGAYDINPGGPPWSFKRFVQDNDAALGLVVELISKSPCWKDTVIFVTEDDTQSGYDSIDGHRTVFLAVGPWVKRQHLLKTHTSLGSIFKTIDVIFGLAPLNLYDATATDLLDIFADKPDYTPYDFVPVAYDVSRGAAWAEATRNVDFSSMDADEVNLRRAIMAVEGLPRTAAREDK